MTMRYAHLAPNNLREAVEMLPQAEDLLDKGEERANAKLPLRDARKRIYGPTNMDYVRVEQLADMATQFIFRMQRTVDDPVVHFRNIVGEHFKRYVPVRHRGDHG